METGSLVFWVCTVQPHSICSLLLLVISASPKWGIYIYAARIPSTLTSITCDARPVGSSGKKVSQLGSALVMFSRQKLVLDNLVFLVFPWLVFGRKMATGIFLKTFFFVAARCKRSGSCTLVEWINYYKSEWYSALGDRSNGRSPMPSRPDAIPPSTLLFRLPFSLHLDMICLLINPSTLYIVVVVVVLFSPFLLRLDGN